MMDGKAHASHAPFSRPPGALVSTWKAPQGFEPGKTRPQTHAGSLSAAAETNSLLSIMHGTFQAKWRAWYKAKLSLYLSSDIGCLHIPTLHP